MSMAAALPTPAQARTPQCCEAGIEDRLRELETGRALGGVPVSLKIAGQVNRTVLLWDDGVATDAFVVNNIYYSTRTVMTAKRRLTAGSEAIASRYGADVDIADTTGPQTGRTRADLRPWSSLVIGSRLKF